MLLTFGVCLIQINDDDHDAWLWWCCIDAHTHTHTHTHWQWFHICLNDFIRDRTWYSICSSSDVLLRLIIRLMFQSYYVRLWWAPAVKLYVADWERNRIFAMMLKDKSISDRSTRRPPRDVQSRRVLSCQRGPSYRLTPGHQKSLNDACV